jgi:hypothetical protein
MEGDSASNSSNKPEKDGILKALTVNISPSEYEGLMVSTRQLHITDDDNNNNSPPVATASQDVDKDIRSININGDSQKICFTTSNMDVKVYKYKDYSRSIELAASSKECGSILNLTSLSFNGKQEVLYVILYVNPDSPNNDIKDLVLTTLLKYNPKCSNAFPLLMLKGYNKLPLVLECIFSDYNNIEKLCWLFDFLKNTLGLRQVLDPSIPRAKLYGGENNGSLCFGRNVDQLFYVPHVEVYITRK